MSSNLTSSSAHSTSGFKANRPEDCGLNALDLAAMARTRERRQQVGFIHSVETCGAVDGPGLRFVAFLSGCPLRCQYCHNPEAQGRPKGEQRRAGDLIDEALSYWNFIAHGGVTLSGGEPLMQADFTRAFFQLAKEAGLHTALDTSGFLGHEADAELLEATDLVLLDIKSGIPAIYKNVTGVELQPTLEFANRLSHQGKKMWIRFVLVPGLTDPAENIAAVAREVAKLQSVERVEILPFHQMGREKYRRLGMNYRLENTHEPTVKEIHRVIDIFADHGVIAI